MSLIVLVNGIDDFGESKAAQNTARTQLFCEQFPQVKVKTFNSFYEQDGFLHDGYPHDKANAIIKSLQRSLDEGEPERIIFVAQNIGAALVKQILLIASEDRRHLWIAFKTIALYFVESPSFTSQREWEQFVLRLLSTNKIPFSNLSTLINVLPRALARIEVQFSAISNAFDIKLYGGEIKSMIDLDKDSWNCPDDELRLSTIFLDVRASLRKNSTQIYTLEQGNNYQEFHSFLSRPDASINRLNAVTVLPKFMTWLETYSSYRSWLNGPKSTVLSITGPNGSGNTYLSSHILHTLVAEHRGSETLFLSYGFYRWDIRRNSERSLVISMIRQLLTLRPGFYRRVDNIARLLSKKPYITCQRLWALFRYLLTIPQHSRVFLVLNATDQCLQPIARKVGLLTTILPLTIPLKILMTSSTTLEMPENVSSERIDLRDAGWGNAIRSLAEERVLQIVNERPVWKDSQQTIVEKLCSGEYTYLYVMLNLDVLAHSKIPSTKDALNQQLMAPTLCIEQVFDTMVSGLEDIEVAKQAINWIFHAVRPLTVSELAVALILKLDPSENKVEKQLTFEILIETVSWDLMRDLGGLLETTVKIVNDRVYFAHHTFHDYLEKHSNLLISNFHALITEWCISYLSMCSEHTSKMSLEYDSLEQPQSGAAAAFLEYAELYWTEHYKLAQQTISTHERAKVRTYAEKKELPPEEMEELSQERKELPPDEKEGLSLDEKVILFLTSDTEAVKRWVEKCTHAFGCCEDLRCDPLFLASQLGLTSIVHHVLQDETAITQERVGEAAINAVRGGNTDILEFLLEIAEASVLVPALRAAAEYGQSNAIKLLLSKMHDSGVASSEADQGVDSPLLLAALNGHTAAFEHLLSEGYSMQALDASNNTALHLASQLGDVDTLSVMQTLQNDIFVSLTKSVNASDMSPLQLTCISGSIDAFDLVRSSAPDDQLGEAKGDSMHPIQLAAKAGHVTIVERLIAAGVDVTVGSSWNKPITLAAGNGHYDVVYCLVEKLEKLLVVDVENLESTDSTPEDLKHSLKNSLSESLNDPLRDAINNGWSKVAKFLLSKTVRDLDEDRTYIWSAVSGGYLDIVEILAVAGISAKPPTDRYDGTLDIAIRENFVDIVSYLVNQGVTPQWDGEENSIHYAAKLGFNLCLHELLRTANDEDVRRKDKNYDNTPLDAAATYGELETFKELLAWETEHALPDQPWRPRLKTLICAITGKVGITNKWIRVDLVNFLLSKGWTADVENGGQDIPLHSAVKAGRLDIVKLLLKEGARVEAIDGSKWSVLHVAAQNGEADIAAFLLENGADPNQRDSDDLTPLHVAAKIENNQLVRVLLGMDREPNGSAKTCSRADVELKGPDGSRALHFACKSSTITSTLLELDPKPQLDAVLNNSKATPLILAAIEGFDEVVRLLLNAGANADSKDSEDRTALYHLASRFNNHTNTARYLTEHNASPNASMIDHSTPLYAAVRNKNDEMALYLLDEANADPNLYGGTLHSPLQAATFRGDINITTRLLNAGADPNVRGGYFGSALHAAMFEGNLEVIELLINEYQAIANLNIPPFGTPLHIQSSMGQSSTRSFRAIATLLLKHDAEMVNRKYNGHTPLTLAMRNEENCFELLDLGANPNVSDDTGATALHYAAGFHSLILVEKLLEKNAKADARDGCNRSVLYFAALSADKDKFNAVLVKLPKEERKGLLAEVVPAVLKARAVAIFDIIIKEESLDLNVPDRSGWTGLDFANCYEMLHEANALEKKGAMKGSTKQEPTGWCFEDRDNSVLLSEDRMEACMEGFPRGSDEDPPFVALGSVRANHPIPMGKGIFYFEVEILDCWENSAIAIGLAQECTTLDSLVGWGPGTWGYHSDDGSLLMEDNLLGSGDPYGVNQIIGVAVDRTQNTAWFTLGGKKVGNLLENVVGQLYPAVSFQQGYSKVKVNFGLKENSAQLKFEPEGGLRGSAIEIGRRVFHRRSRTRDDSLDRQVFYRRRNNYDGPDDDIYESRSVISYDRYDRHSMASYDRHDRHDRDSEDIRNRRDRDGDYDRRSDRRTVG